jgi:hypothetical protein
MKATNRLNRDPDLYMEWLASAAVESGAESLLLLQIFNLFVVGY